LHREVDGKQKPEISFHFLHNGVGESSKRCNFMRDFKEHHQTIRQFLLGQLSDDKAKEIEERIFAEGDFAEEVQIVENELITNYYEGTS